MSDFVLILTTVPDDHRAEILARTLVEERLAACVNLHGTMVSVYQWQGSVQRDAERQVVIKTMRWRVPAVEARIRAFHTYEVPEFLVVAVEGGSDTYLAWIKETLS
jgi:periplasmic divalent cation tolerance protein